MFLPLVSLSFFMCLCWWEFILTPGIPGSSLHCFSFLWKLSALSFYDPSSMFTAEHVFELYKFHILLYCLETLKPAMATVGLTRLFAFPWRPLPFVAKYINVLGNLMLTSTLEFLSFLFIYLPPPLQRLTWTCFPHSAQGQSQVFSPVAHLGACHQKQKSPDLILKLLFW